MPLLILHWAYHHQNSPKEKPITRVNILPSLFAEAHSFFSTCLTASIANLRIFQLPFCRDVVVDNLRLRLMTRMIDQCRLSNGIFIVAPEHRLSMELKVHELSRRGENFLEVSRSLSEVCNALNWRDVLDESDELLHHRYRLIYATGDVEMLPGGPDRYQAAQILLNRISTCKEVRSFVDLNKSAFVYDTKKSGMSCGNLRINSKTVTVSLIHSLQKILVESIVKRPPYCLDWLRDHPGSTEITDFLVNPRSSTKSIAELGLTGKHRQSLLAFRGLLSGGILTSCLRKRHRVDYGVARRGKKRIAVPFRGADTPAERSEFAHPDMAILLTCRSYYEDGLQENDIRTTFSELLALGRESRRKQYNNWFTASLDMMTEHGFDHSSINEIDKIDLSNDQQFSCLVTFFSRNYLTVNFWLNTCVFPYEMQHFPYRMTATSWNLAENSIGGWVGGFSGTNDNHRALPLQVKQYFASPNAHTETPESKGIWMSLMGTNGLMVDCISKNSLGCHELTDMDPLDAILEFMSSYDDQIHALIDCGAILAGASRSATAKKLLHAVRSRSDLRGVTFFDGAEWKIMEENGRTTQKDVSPVDEKDAFAFYDEPRCRGSDLKLRHNAVAVLTLGPCLCKDKFMQAAGRLRKLGKGQKLVIVGTKEVMTEIQTVLKQKRSANITVIQVLEWTVRNTIDSAAEACLPWASQGFFHATSYGNHDLVVEKELSTLEELYGESFVGIQASKAVVKAKNHYLGRMERQRHTLFPESTKIVESIMERSKDFENYLVSRNQGIDEECERELEIEREVEREEEMEIPKVSPRAEQEWPMGELFLVDGPQDLSPRAKVQRLSKFVSRYLSPSSISKINWNDSVYGTSNFFLSVSSQHTLNNYLRMVDAALFFPRTNEVLLLSERETDLIIKEIHEFRHSRKRKSSALVAAEEGFTDFRFVLFHLMFARTASDGKVKGVVPGAVTLGVKMNNKVTPWNHLLPDNILACLQLFAGETVYPTEERRKELKKCIRKSRGEPLLREARALADMRHYTHCYPYSDLEQVCKEIEREHVSRSCKRKHA